MIVHKATMGVVDRVYTGKNQTGPDGVVVPVMREARLSDYPWLDPAEWWDVTDPALQKRLRRYYPDLRPVVDEAGELVDAEILRPEEDREAEKTAQAEARARGYKRKGNLRRTGLMPFLVKGGT